ncbi:MAG TPA: chloride channel protein [Thermoplasmata archaeon]|nr:chloride channel protein [Thermoplasmata archaeon]
MRPRLLLPELPRVTEIVLLTTIGTLIAFAAGGAAFLLYHLIGFFTNAFYFGRLSWDVVDPASGPLAGTVGSIGIPILGAVIVALMIRFGSEKISGHGTPEAMEAVLVAKSKIQPRVGLLKPLSAAIAIGSGTPSGAEGPIIQTGGAIGSIVGQFIRLTAAERRTLLACGAAAGMAATFGTPIASILLVIELLLFEFRARSFIPVSVASAIATLIHYTIFSPGPLFPVPSTVPFGGLGELPAFAFLGILAGLVAAAITRSMYTLEGLFIRLPVPRIWLPPLGGLAVGLLGFFEPEILGVGYGTIQSLVSGSFVLIASAVLALFLAKAIAMLVSLSSGNSGGVLAPLFFIGGAFGALFGLFVVGMDPAFPLPPAAFALVGMAAVFGAASRATFASIVFAVEVTGAVHAAVPLVVGCGVADVVMILLMGDMTIMTEKLARRGLLVRHEYEANLLDMVPVSRVMATQPIGFATERPIDEFRSRLADPARPESTLRSFAVTDIHGRVVGVVTRRDLAQRSEGSSPKVVADVMTPNPVTVKPEQRCSAALEAMVMRDVGHLPVVDDEARLVGYLSRGDLLRAWRSRIEEEREKEIVFRLWRRGPEAPTPDPPPPSR